MVVLLLLFAVPVLTGNKCSGACASGRPNACVFITPTSGIRNVEKEKLCE